jgi:ComF family protein
MSLLHDVISLLFPQVCAACGTLLYRNEETVCLSCRYLLPRTGYETVPDNPVARIFWGRVRLEAAMACFFFSKKGKVQNLIHELKYKGNYEAGHFLGVETGKSLLKSSWFQSVDLMVPVPLHPKRQRKRGYNQSEVLAKGINESAGISLITNNLVRMHASETQTKKSRSARWENVKDIFALQRPDELKGKHVLLVDDVVTTGSTVEACVQTLMQVEGIRVSVAAAACAPA